jgi:uncharacterized membrane protein YhaH (DUF805 family)
LTESSKLLWAFFKFSGRIGRAPYILGFLFMTVAISFPLYQFMRVPEDSDAARLWSLVFGASMLAFLWAHVAFSVKRLHDMDKPGLLAVVLFIPVISVVAFIALCVMPGSQGSNRYGRYANMPAGEN